MPFGRLRQHAAAGGAARACGSAWLRASVFSQGAPLLVALLRWCCGDYRSGSGSGVAQGWRPATARYVQVAGAQATGDGGGRPGVLRLRWTRRTAAGRPLRCFDSAAGRVLQPTSAPACAAAAEHRCGEERHMRDALAVSAPWLGARRTARRASSRRVSIGARRSGPLDVVDAWRGARQQQRPAGSANKHLHPAALCCRLQLPGGCCALVLPAAAAQPLKFWSGTATASSAPPCGLASPCCFRFGADGAASLALLGLAIAAHVPCTARRTLRGAARSR
ncbi:hypothetical protein FA09DRAFT_264044 [Tilletiopsis washingtonensis]|jgi:hypothetical protein|uniref:Uncharacterized protein n=1 Tax=Tilletiopsis washingtonensis TaxID=58919 RepID=A0A316ZBM6_9BASI|nr:hypothetical protein FA09DRAFT_264044 [Tilletiopsis washingtonensis]PWN98434.1 hypothetical protein FA09DRAFT_264044 [Tilletiopsis washingtonensis]